MHPRPPRPQSLLKAVAFFTAAVVVTRTWGEMFAV